MTFEDQSSQNNDTVYPFLKWAGGKRWLAPLIADEIKSLKGKYFEPFLGSGAIFFYTKPNNALLSDSNSDLIATYLAIKKKPKTIEKILETHRELHCEEYYYKIRSIKPIGIYEKAGRFIYLNRTCWNGLYRVNLKGEFNVPIGTKNSVTLASDDWAKLSKLLSRAEILCQDFEATIDQAKENDLIFADPPYTVKHNNNGFIKYNNKLFSWSDQIRLRDSLKKAKRRGAKIILTNANHSSIKELYKDYFNFEIFSRNSVLSGLPEFRGKYEELVIR